MQSAAVPQQVSPHSTGSDAGQPQRPAVQATPGGQQELPHATPLSQHVLEVHTRPLSQ